MSGMDKYRRLLAEKRARLHDQIPAAITPTRVLSSRQGLFSTSDDLSDANEWSGRQQDKINAYRREI